MLAAAADRLQGLHQEIGFAAWAQCAQLGGQLPERCGVFLGKLSGCCGQVLHCGAMLGSSGAGVR